MKKNKRLILLLLFFACLDTQITIGQTDEESDGENTHASSEKSEKKKPSSRFFLDEPQESQNTFKQESVKNKPFEINKKEFSEKKKPIKITTAANSSSSEGTSEDELNKKKELNKYSIINIRSDGENKVILLDKNVFKSVSINAEELPKILSKIKDNINNELEEKLNNIRKKNEYFYKTLNDAFNDNNEDLLHYVENTIKEPDQYLLDYYLMTDVVYINKQPMRDLKTFTPYRYYGFLEKLKREKERYTSQIDMLNSSLKRLSEFLTPLPVAISIEESRDKDLSEGHTVVAGNPKIIEKTTKFLKESLKGLIDPASLSRLSQSKEQNLWMWMEQIRETKGQMGDQLSFINYQIQSLESDPIFKYYFYKMSPHESLKRYTPVLVMYRHQETPSAGSLLDPISYGKYAVALAKGNPTAIQERGEPSGMVLLRKSAKKADEIVFSFSGSNSTNDWLANFDSVASKIGLKHIFDAGLQSRYLPKLTGNPGIFFLFHVMMTSSEGPLTDFLKLYVDELTYRKGKAPHIKLVATGHSLGGAVALLMGYYLNNVVKPYIQKTIPNATVDVQIYTYAAPAILDQQSASHYEATLGQENIIRTHTVGDPIPYLTESPAARFSFISSKPKDFERMKNKLTSEIKELVENETKEQDQLMENLDESLSIKQEEIQKDMKKAVKTTGFFGRSMNVLKDLVTIPVRTPVNWLASFLHGKYVGSYWHVGTRVPLVDGLQFFANRNSSGGLTFFTKLFQNKIKHKGGIMTRHGRDYYRHLIKDNIGKRDMLRKSFDEVKGLSGIIDAHRQRLSLGALQASVDSAMKESDRVITQGEVSIDLDPKISIPTEVWNKILNSERAVHEDMTSDSEAIHEISNVIETRRN